MIRRTAILSAVLCSLVVSACAQQPKIDFETYNPPTTLVVDEHPRKSARFPFIDVHNHQYGMSSGKLDQLVADMDSLNLKVMVNLSGGTGEGLKRMVDNAKSQYPGRFVIFANIDFSGIGNAGWTDRAVAQLKQDYQNGARGLKVFKNLGLSVKDSKGNRVAVNDSRLDPIWETCGKLKIPVLIHTADPASFWDPLDETNERLLELYTHPRRKRSEIDPAPFEDLIKEQHAMFKKHPATTFIAAHFGWYPNNLKKLDSLLQEMPHVVVEFGAVIAELGRQPRAALAFFTRYQDRILFGKDSWVPSEYATYFRVLETNDEYFPYHKKYHAFWPMYGMGLPEPILKKIYYRNALRIIPGIDSGMFPE